MSQKIKLVIPSKPKVKLNIKSGRGGGTNDYNLLFNKPSLNGVPIQHDRESQDYKLTLSVQEIEKILYLD